jgi:pyruvate formate lyase activating enzyme
MGRRMTVEDVLAEALKDRIFYEESGGGVTFSGGEPLFQAEFLVDLLSACKAGGLHTALDTCGHAAVKQLLRAATLSDLVLYDLKLMDPRRHQQLTGVSNELVLDNLHALGQVHRNIWIRFPVIPGFNDNQEQLEAVARIATALPGVRQVNLLPYHRTGVGKRANPSGAAMPAVEPPSTASLEHMAATLRASGLKVIIGG